MTHSSTPLRTVLTLVAATAGAHHSTAGIYEQTLEVELKGKVKEWRFINPHPSLKIEVVDDKGVTHEWDVSYGGNAVAAAAAIATIDVIADENLVENARVVGAAMLAELQAFEGDYPFVGHVRGRGLFLGLELVRDKLTKEPLSRKVTRRIFDACVQRGLLTMAYAPSFRIQPALTIDLATAKNGIAALREVFDALKQNGGWDEP